MQIQQKKTLSASRVPPNRDEPPTGADMSIRFDNQDVTRDDPAYSSGPTAADSRDTGRNATRVQDPMTSSDQTHTGRSNTHLGDIEVERLAARALRILVDRAEVSDAATPFAQLFALTDAYLDADSRARHDLLAGLLRRGVSPTQVVEEIVPATARYMGKLWVHDKLSFAEVTIGAARLQETVRAMTVRRPRKTHHDAAPRILLIVPRTEHHTLGIFVLAEQFRRRGCLVHVIVGSHPQEILDTIRAKRFDLIGISAGGRRSLAAVRDLIRVIRVGVPRNNTIVVGGAALALGLDVASVTGADFATCDVGEALDRAGIQLPLTQPRVTDS